MNGKRLFRGDLRRPSGLVLAVVVISLSVFVEFATARLAIFTPQYDILDPLTGRSIRDPRTRSKNLALRDNPLLFRPLNNEGVRTQREIPLQRANPKYLLPIGRHRDVSNLASAPVLPKEQRHVNYRRGKSISQLAETSGENDEFDRQQDFFIYENDEDDFETAAPFHEPAVKDPESDAELEAFGDSERFNREVFFSPFPQPNFYSSFSEPNFSNFGTKFPGFAAVEQKRHPQPSFPSQHHHHHQQVHEEAEAVVEEEESERKRKRNNRRRRRKRRKQHIDHHRYSFQRRPQQQRHKNPYLDEPEIANVAADLSTNEVPISAGIVNVGADDDRYTLQLQQPNGNAFAGLVPYKWRKKYPYYGGRRKKRSAQSSFDNIRRRLQTSWILLDPMTGRPMNTPYREVEPKQKVISHQQNQHEEPQFFEPKDRFARFNTVLPQRSNDVNAFSSGSNQPLHSYYLNPRFTYDGRPVYKHHKRYPYAG